MKTLCFTLSDRLFTIKRIFTAGACLLTGVLTSTATVTVQGWWRGGEAGSIMTDSSTNGRSFTYSYSGAGGGNPDAGIVTTGVGGPLGTSGATSTKCMVWNINTYTTGGTGYPAGAWNPASPNDITADNPIGLYNPPASNYVIECWVLPFDSGVQRGGSVQFFASGSSDNGQSGGRGATNYANGGDGPGGVYFELLTNSTLQVIQLGAFIVANAAQGVTNDTQIGTWVTASTTNWTHLAVVNFGGTNNSFFVNGILNGSTNLSTIPNYDIGLASHGESTSPTYVGFLDECRISTFAPGAFSTSDFLLPPPGPAIVSQSQSEVVWDGGAATFDVTTAYDTNNAYQWQLGGGSLTGATNAEYYLNVVASSNDAAVYSCLIENSSGQVTSSNAVLTVVPTNAAVISVYRTNVLDNPSLLAYFEVDGNTGANLTDSKGTNVGVLLGTAQYDGRTNRAFGSRAIAFPPSHDGAVVISNNPAFEFGNTANQSGTIEAIVYLDYIDNFLYTNINYDYQGNETIIADEGTNQGLDTSTPTYYSIQTSQDGSVLYFQSDASPNPIVWSLVNPLVGRAAYIAIVFTNGTITPYIDGASVGTQANPGFGTSGNPLWIGSSGGLMAPTGGFAGTIDELAIYSNALSAATIGVHNAAFVYGTNQVPPSITLYTGASANLYAGGLAPFTVAATGSSPLSYQWTSNSTNIPGATTSTFTLGPTTTNMSATYGVTVSNPYGHTNLPPFTLAITESTNTHVSLMMADNPMALWQLNETSGTIAYDVAGGNNGTYTTNVVLGGTGVPGSLTTAAHFDASHVFDTYYPSDVTVPFNPNLNPQGAFSIEYWANPDYNFQSENIAGVQISSAAIQAGTQVNGYVSDDFLDNGNGFEITLANPFGESLAAYSGASAPANTWYDIVCTWDGAGNIYTYQNGTVLGYNSYSANGGTFAANVSAPLIIGNRNDLTWPFPGYLQFVAIYNYALSPAQIASHYEIPPVITKQPVGVTNVEPATVTLTVGVTGSPNTYQWYRNNQPLQQTLNADGTEHYSEDVTNPILTITETEPTVDSGTYYLAINNPIQNIVSSNVIVSITPDTVPPMVESVTGLGTPGNPNTGYSANAPFLVKVVFSKRVDYTTGSNPANYTFSPAVTISSMTLLGNSTEDIQAAALGADYRVALLATTGLTPGQKYTLTISGLKDQSETPLNVATSTNYFRAPALTTGVVNWDYYYLGASTPAAALPITLQGDANFQAGAPMTNRYFTAFDSHQITDGTLSDNPAFGALGDQYGDVVSGWITPTVSDSYTFFMDSDDESALYLSSDANPANANMIVYNAGCCTGFVETNSSTVTGAGGLGNYVSTPQALTAGQSYYIQTLHGQGGGGDYVRVAWRGTISTDQTTPAANLSPIPGTYLSAYENAAPAFNAPSITNGILTLPWSGLAGVIQASTNLVTWTNVPGNPSPLVVPVNSGTNALFFRLIQSQ